MRVIEQREYEAATKARYRAKRRDLGADIRQYAHRQGVSAADLDMIVAVILSQNVLKEAIAAVARASMPQGELYFAELATRIACYCITALPPNDQDVMAVRVRDGLLEKLGQMQAAGHGLMAEWR